MCSEYLQALLELVYMLRTKNKKDTNDSDVYDSSNIVDGNRSDDNNVAETPGPSSSSSSASPEPSLLGEKHEKQPKMGQETIAAAQGQGLDPLTAQGVPQMEGSRQRI